ncbi:MAG: rhodanese-like domain-containing protein [Actinomycetota bacterium]
MTIAAADRSATLAHFQHLLAVETDCADVNRAQSEGTVDFVLLDVRSEAAFAAGHVAGATNIPTASLSAERLAAYPADTTFVVYCAGPHCNGADKAALRLAELDRPVKKMIGGVTGWLDEGLSLTATESTTRQESLT